MNSLNMQIEMQDKFNLKMKLEKLEAEKLMVESQIENIKRILYGSNYNAESSEKRGRKNGTSKG